MHIHPIYEIILSNKVVSNSNVVRVVAMANAEPHTLSISFVKKLAEISLQRNCGFDYPS